VSTHSEAQHLPRGDHSRHLLLKNIYTLELSMAGARRWVLFWRR
jgi:hypothetical protein